MSKRNLSLLAVICLFVVSGCIPAEMTPTQKLAAGKQQMAAGNTDAAMTNFIDVLTGGTADQAQEANQYINQIHNAIGGVAQPVFVPDGGTAPAQASASSDNYDGGPSYQGHILGQGTQGYASQNTLGGAYGDTGTGVSGSQIDKAQTFVVTSLRQNAVTALENTKGVKVYYRNNDIDAIDIDSSVLFSTPSKFSDGGRKILENLYTLMVLSPKPTFVILPPGSYTDNVQLTGVKNAVATASYLIYRGISPAKLSYNMGLYNEEPPAKFSNLDGLSVVFDYDTPPVLSMPKSGEKLPIMSLAVAPSSQAMYSDAEGGMLLDYSVIESSSPITDWKLQIIQQGADKQYYVIRQVEGSGPVYNQTFWNGRRNVYGDKLPAGTYTALLTATDANGKTKTLSRKLTIVNRTASSSSSGASYGTSGADYQAGYLWTRASRTNVSSDMPVPASGGSGSSAGRGVTASSSVQPYQPDSSSAPSTAGTAPVTPGADYGSGYTAADFAAAKTASGTAPTAPAGPQPYQPSSAPGGAAGAGAGSYQDNSAAGANDDTNYQYSYN